MTDMRKKTTATRAGALDEVQVIRDDAGAPAFAVVPWARYEALAATAEDARDAAIADAVRADLAAGRQELLPTAMVARLVAGESPIRVWREHRGLTQAQLANAAGLKQGYVSELESGRKTNPTIETLIQIARPLGCTLDDLVVEAEADKNA